jgi:hypothetical protein
MDDAFSSNGNKEQTELEMDSEHLQNRDSGDGLHIDDLGGLSQPDQIDELNAVQSLTVRKKSLKRAMLHGQIF